MMCRLCGPALLVAMLLQILASAGGQDSPGSILGVKFLRPESGERFPGDDVEIKVDASEFFQTPLAPLEQEGLIWELRINGKLATNLPLSSVQPEAVIQVLDHSHGALHAQNGEPVPGGRFQPPVDSLSLLPGVQGGTQPPSLHSAAASRSAGSKSRTSCPGGA